MDEEEEVEEVEQAEEPTPPPFDPDDTQEIPEYVRELVTQAVIATMGEAAKLDQETKDLLEGLREEPKKTPP